MSMEYSILDNRPINKWKVVELREELKRRNSSTKGLKDELVKRLEEAIRIEKEANEVEEGNGSDSSEKEANEVEEGNGSDSSEKGNVEDAKADGSGVNLAEGVVDPDNKELLNKFDEDGNQMDLDDAPTECGQEKVVSSAMTISSDQPAIVSSSPISDVDDKVFQIASSDERVPDTKSSGKSDEIFEDSEKDALETSVASSAGILDSKVASSMDIDEAEEKIVKKEVEVKNLNPRATIVEDYEVKPENKTLESSEVAAADHNKAHSSDQVYDEVSPNLGFKVKSESFSTLTNNENELKNNLNADNVQLESEFVSQEVAQPSFCSESRGVGTICPSDDLISRSNQSFNVEIDDKPKNLEFSEKNDKEDELSVVTPVVGRILENEVTEKVVKDNVQNQMDSAKDASPVPLVSPQRTEPPVEEKFNIADFGEESNPQDCHDFNKTIDVMDGELLEKVNLDQSSADEMEEDTLDAKLVESDNNLSKMDESNKEPGVGVSDGLHHSTPTDKLELSNDHIESVTSLFEKRKFQDATEAGSNIPPKRQRRFDTEGQKTSEFRNDDASVPTRSNLTLHTASARPNSSRSNYSPKIETPKERVVPPSERTPTTSLRIDNFVRPFTLKAVLELLAKTGKACSFWMDHIKTHCYVTFSTAEEAIETRNAVYNLQWPTNGGRLLVADFVDPEEVKLRVEGLSQSAGPSANSKTPAVGVQPAEPSLQQVPKQQQEPEHPLSHVPPTRDPSVKGQLPRAPSVDENGEAPMPSLDDLFRKTKATPRIYYLPLSDKEVAAKVPRQKSQRQ